MTGEQLAFDLAGWADTAVRQGGHLVGDQLHRPAELRRGLGPGAERLLGELVRRGLDEDHLHAAAAIALVLDEEAIDR